MCLLELSDVPHRVTWAEHDWVRDKALFIALDLAHFVGLELNATVMVDDTWAFQANQRG